MATIDTTRPLRIGELAAQLGVNTKTIRYYEDIGLLPAPRRTEAGYRLYGDADRQRLAFIRKARAIGLSLEEISQLLALRREGEQPCGHLRELVDRKLVAVEAQLRALTEFRQELVSLRNEATTTACTDGQLCAAIERHRPRHDDPNRLAPVLSTIARRR